VPQPVFELHATVPVTTFGLRVVRPFTSPVSLVIVAVNVTDWPWIDGLELDETATLPLASAALVVSATCAAAE
jgi:hypothetical protein